MNDTERYNQWIDDNPHVLGMVAALDDLDGDEDDSYYADACHEIWRDVRHAIREDWPNHWDVESIHALLLERTGRD